MRHKIISVFIACAMLFGICNISYADEQSVENSSLSEKDAKVINFINKMGFSADVFEEEPASQQKITRAEFAMLISHILGFDMPNAGEVFFEDILGDVDKSEIFITEDSVGEMRFSDVNEAHPAYSYIKYVSSLGLMTGTSEKTFSPDKNITVTESLKPLIKALNYTLAAELKGGYPSGYITVADELKLLKNVKQNIEDEATALSVYHLLYNALHTAIYEQTGYSLDNITFSSDRDLMLITKIFNTLFSWSINNVRLKEVFHFTVQYTCYMRKKCDIGVANALFPLTHRLGGNAYQITEFTLREPMFLSVLLYLLRDRDTISSHSH